MIAQNLDATQICADQLTEGDIIRHVETPPNTQQVIFAASWKFELLDYQPLMTA